MQSAESANICHISAKVLKANIKERFMGNKGFLQMSIW